MSACIECRRRLAVHGDYCLPCRDARLRALRWRWTEAMPSRVKEDDEGYLVVGRSWRGCGAGSSASGLSYGGPWDGDD